MSILQKQPVQEKLNAEISKITTEIRPTNTWIIKSIPSTTVIAINARAVASDIQTWEQYLKYAEAVGLTQSAAVP